MAEQNEFNLEESLIKLNEIWTLTLENAIDYYTYMDEVNSRIREIKAMGYKMILGDKLKAEELSELTETSNIHATEIKRIQLEKIEAIKNGRMENAAWLRDQEKFLISEVLNSYFGNPSIHFKLYNTERKEILRRPAFHKFQVPLLYFDWTKKKDIKQP